MDGTPSGGAESYEASELCNGMECELQKGPNALKKVYLKLQRPFLCPWRVIDSGPTSKCQIIIALRIL